MKKLCLKTMSGEHYFKKVQYGYIETKEGNTIMGTPRYVLKCDFCGIIDDRKIRTTIKSSK